MHDKFSNIISSIIAVAGLIATSLWGGWDVAMSSLILFMAIDFVTGVLGGKVRKELSSCHAGEGIVKKIITLLLVAVAYRLDLIIGADGGIKSLVVFFFLGQEGISIIENAAVLGIPIPEGLKNSLIQLQEGQKKDISD